MKKGLEACKRKTCTKIRSSIRESPQAQPSNIVTSSNLASHLLWANSARSKDAVKTGIDKSTEAVGMCLALLSPSPPSDGGGCLAARNSGTLSRVHFL